MQKLCAETSESVQKLRAQRITLIFTSLPFRPMLEEKAEKHRAEAFKLKTTRAGVLHSLNETKKELREKKEKIQASVFFQAQLRENRFSPS